MAAKVIDSPNPAAGRRDSGGWWVGVIAALLIAAYANSLAGPLIMDDYATIVENPSLRNWRDFRAVFSPPGGLPTVGRPLANFTFALNYAWGGTQVRGYHVVNLAIHILAAWLLFGVVRRTLLARRDATFLAGMAAAVWALHPVQTASVTYIAQRTELLAGLCYFATLYAFVRGASERKFGWLALSVLACALGMLAKETVVTAPVIVLLYDRILIGGSFGAALRERRVYYASLACTWMLLFASLRADTFQRGVGFELGLSAWQYALTQTRSLLIYLRLGGWPAPLIFDYGPQALKTVAAALPFAAPLIVLLCGAGLLLRRIPPLGFCVIAFFVLLAPSSSFVPIAFQPTAENRLYLPLAAILTGATVAMHVVVGRRLLLVGAVGILALTLLTAARNHRYRTDLALWTDTVAKRPDNPRAYDNVALALCNAGKPAEAIPYLTHALELNPASVPTRVLMGNACYLSGRLEDAARYYVEAVRLNPAWTNPRFNLGVVYRQLGRPRDALPQFEMLLRADPNNADVHWNMGLALAALNELAAALPFLERAVRFAPQRTDILNSYGAALENLGRVEEAIAAYQRSLEIEPRQPEAATALARVRAQAGARSSAPGAVR